MQLSRQTCCGLSWVGADRAHCCARTGGCGGVFDDAELFDAHRDHGTCTDPRTLDLVQTKNHILAAAPRSPDVTAGRAGKQWQRNEDHSTPTHFGPFPAGAGRIGYMDDDSSDRAALDGDALDEANDHDENVPVTDDIVEPDPELDEENTPLNVPGAEVAAAGATSANTAAAAGQTVLERMRSAGIDDARARQHLQQGWVSMDGEVITDPDHPAAPPARWVILPLLDDHEDVPSSVELRWRPGDQSGGVDGLIMTGRTDGFGDPSQRVA